MAFDPRKACVEAATFVLNMAAYEIDHRLGGLMLHFQLALVSCLSSLGSIAPDIEEAKAGLLHRAAALKNASFDVDMAAGQRSYQGGRVKDTSNRTSILLDSDGNLKINTLRIVNDKKTVETTVITDQESRFLSKQADSKTGATIGEVLAIRRRDKFVELPVHPFSLLFLGRYSPLNWTRKVGMTDGGADVIDGTESIRLDWHADDPAPAKSSRRGSYWVAPALGYAILRYSEERRPSPDMKWRPTLEIESREHELASNLLVPGKIHYREYSYFNSGRHELMIEVDAIFSNWKVNHPIPAGAFKLPFPKGAYVRDLIVGGPPYLQKEITDASLERQVKEARSLIRRPDDMPVAPRFESSRWPATLGLTLGVALTLLGILIGVRWIRTRKQ